MKYTFRAISCIYSLFLLSACSLNQSSIEALSNKENYRIAFGSCVKSSPTDIWKKISKINPDIFLMLGDGIYLPARSLEAQEVRRIYEAQYKNEDARELFERVPVLAIWDDHDFGVNNSDSRSVKHREARAVFKEHWNNPAPPHSLEESIAFKIDFGKILLLATDNRTFRLNASSSENPKAFGQAQIDWLVGEIRKSQHEIIILASASQFLSETEYSESFSYYESERQQILEAIDTTSAKVIILSGDRHYSEVLEERIEGVDGFKSVWELTSSPLNARTQRYSSIRPDPRRRGLYAQSANFGILDIDITGPKSSLRVRYFNQHGEQVLSLSLY